MSVINVFTDGSFMKRKIPICGYGIYFPEGELPNISRKFTHEPLTNQRAELFAMYVALLIINKVHKWEQVILYSDSEYSIKCVTIWKTLWEKNMWKTSSGSQVKNQDILQPLYSVLDKFKGKVTFVHVNSHTNKTDYKSLGNAMADKLATDGAQK